MTSLIALLSGLVFGLGLIESGMTDPAKVKGFLDLFGAGWGIAGYWDHQIRITRCGSGPAVP